MVEIRYDFQEETLVFAGPRQVIGLDDTGELFQPKGWWLAFQPELLNNTPLGERIKNYNFFSYALNEALHLSLNQLPLLQPAVVRAISVELVLDSSL